MENGFQGIGSTISIVDIGALNPETDYESKSIDVERRSALGLLARVICRRFPFSRSGYRSHRWSDLPLYPPTRGLPSQMKVDAGPKSQRPPFIEIALAG